MPHRLFSRFLEGGAALALLSLAAGAVAQTPAPDRFNLFVQPTPPPAASPTPTPAGTGYTPPKVLKQSPITYPILANLNRIEGIVGVRFAIDENGAVKDATVYRPSHSVLLDSVVRSRGFLSWTFVPATLNGRPIPSTLDKEIEFRLDPAEQRQFALKRLAAPIGIPDPPYPPEALAIHPHPGGDCTIGVFWTETGSGLVDIINLLKGSGSPTLDHAALLFAYENWHIDPKQIKDPKEQYTRVLTFTPPADDTGTGTVTSSTPPPLASAAPTPAPTTTPATTPKKRGH